MEEKQLLFTLSKENGDFAVQPFKGTGNGGQKKNKTMSACRIIHPASNTVSECQEERSFTQNKRKAFARLLEKESFKNWYKLECMRRNGETSAIEEAVEKALAPEKLLVEGQVDGKWTQIDI